MGGMIAGQVSNYYGTGGPNTGSPNAFYQKITDESKGGDDEIKFAFQARTRKS